MAMWVGLAESPEVMVEMVARVVMQVAAHLEVVEVAATMAATVVEEGGAVVEKVAAV